MSGWFTKAKNALSRPEPEKPQPFQLSCECGELHSGFRRQRHQRLICKVCGRALFLLPRDVYPPPQAARPPKQTDVTSPRDDLTEVAPVSITKLRKRTKGKQAEDPETAHPRTKSAPASASSRQHPVSQKIPTHWSRELWTQWEQGLQHFFSFRFWNPFRIVSLSVIVIVLFTTAWMIRQSQLAHALAVVKKNGEQGLAAIQQSDWLTAQTELALTVPALDRLGRQDPDAQRMRQYARETQALTSLCSNSLGEILKDAAEERARQGESSQQRQLTEQLYRGQWLILEGVLRDVRTKNKRNPLYEMPLPGMDAAVQVSGAPFAKLIPKGESRSTIFAGEVKACRFDDDSQRWIIELTPQSAFLWSHLETYLAAGFELNHARPEPVVTAELQAQAQAVGEQP